MGNCIICGTSTDGPICDIHQEDVVFEFRGDRPDQLTPGRFYRGTVDGYADFGVFVNVGERVTGLLHRSKLDKRLENLEWAPGDVVYVQVNNIRDNGDIDLDWSIRQSDREFRGTLVDTPEGDKLPEEETESADEATKGETAEGETAEGEAAGGAESASADASTAAEEESGDDSARPSGPESDSPPARAREPEASGDDVGDREETAGVEQVAVGSLRERVGEDVRLEGELVTARQTSGPTVFELRDGTGVVDAAAFEEAGVRAYPEADAGDVVRLEGEVRLRRDELQVETSSLEVLSGDEREAVQGRMDAALEDEAALDSVELLADDDAVAAVEDDVAAVATAVRRAVLESRPVIVRHPATADGYVAGAAIERAVLPLVREEHAQSDAAYHYFDRRPLEGDVYDMDDATADVTNMLDAQERHGEKLPLVVFAGAAGTVESLDGLELLGVYDVERVVVDGTAIDEGVRDIVAATIAPESARTATVTAATVAASVTDDVRDDLRHLPAVSYWSDAPEQYVDLASEAGVDAETARQLREAIALEAYYQSYEDKRELVIDLLFERRTGLAEQVSTQFRQKLDDELATAEANLERREAGGVTFAVLDTDAFTHRFDFPPTPLLLDELHRRQREADRPFVTVGVADDELSLRATADVNVQQLADAVRERAPDAGVTAYSSRSAAIEFLTGERDAVVDAVVDTVAERLSAEAEA